LLHAREVDILGLQVSVHHLLLVLQPISQMPSCRTISLLLRLLLFQTIVEVRLLKNYETVKLGKDDVSVGLSTQKRHAAE